jgi:hypothetical protein
MGAASAVGLTSISSHVLDVAARNQLTPVICPVLTMTEEILRGCSIVLQVERELLEDLRFTVPHAELLRKEP